MLNPYAPEGRAYDREAGAYRRPTVRGTGYGASHRLLC
jgi:hypothetical protein